MGLGILLLFAAAPMIVVTAPKPAPRAFAVRPLPEVELAAMRGGLRLPNGLDLALGIDIQTRVDGLLALHTVYASEGSSPGIRVYTDGANPVRTPPALETIKVGMVSGPPVLIVDRSPTGTTILPATGMAPSTVNLVQGDPSIWLSGEGQVEVPVEANGPAIAAPPGDISLKSTAAGAVVTLKAPDLEVQQLIGQSTGVAIVNSANDRAIDTISAINVDLRGLSSALLTSTFAAQRAALEATLSR